MKFQENRNRPHYYNHNEQAGDVIFVIKNPQCTKTKGRPKRSQRPPWYKETHQ